MAKPVVVDFTARNAQLKASIAESSAALRAFDEQVKTGSASWDKLSASNERWGRTLVASAKVGAVGMAGVTAALGGAVVAAANFDSAMRNVNSIAGLSQAGFKGLEAQVLRLSTAVGKSPTDLANGLYSIVSSSFKAQDAMKILAVGAKAARAGLTDTATATQALTAVLNAYHLKASDARNVSDVLFQTVNKGVLNFEQLSGSLGKILPRANSLHVGLKDLMGAMAALTLQGNNADESATQLGATLTTFSKPNKALTAEFKTLGFATASSAVQTLGFKGTLDALGKAADGSGETIAKWFPNSRAARGFLALEGSTKDVQVFTSTVKAMDDATKGAGETQLVYAEQQKSTAAQFDHLKAAIDVAAITIGTALLPEVNKGITALSAWLAQAQKSGELQSFAQTNATDVKATVAWLASLGPAAEKAIKIVSDTFAAAIPYVQGLEHILQTLAPEFEAVGHAAVTLTGSIGPGPIIGAVGAYLLLNRSLLTAQAGMGKFAAVMKAGSEATALAGGGAVTASGRIDSIGKAAVANASTASIAARGLASAFGPGLLIAGAAGIVGSLLYIRSTMTSLKDEARDVVEATAQFEGAKLAHTAATIAVGQQTVVVAKAKANLGPAAAAVEAAREAAPQGGHPDIANPAITKAIDDQKTAILNYRSQVNQLTQDQTDASVAGGKMLDAQKKIGTQLVGFGQKALGTFLSQGAGASFLGSDASSAAAQGAKVRDLTKDAADLAKTLRDGAAASTTLGAAGKLADDRMASFVVHFAANVGRLPTKSEFHLIADDEAANRSNAKIFADLKKLDGTVVNPKVDVDTAGGDAKVNALKRNIDGLHSKTLTISEILSVSKLTGGKTNPLAAGGMYIDGVHGADDVRINVTGSEAVLAPKHISMVDSGRYTVMGALAATGAPTIHRGGGYSAGAKPAKPKPVQYESFPLKHYTDQRDNAAKLLSTDKSTLTGYAHSEAKINKSITDAQKKVATAKTAATRKKYQEAADALVKRSQAPLAGLIARISNTQSLIQNRDEPELTEATRIAKAATAYQRRITNDQNDAQYASNEMSLASDQWSAANTRGDARGMAAAIAKYNAAAKKRTGADTALKTLLAQAQGVLKDNGPYWKTITDQITSVDIDQTQASDSTAVPGYAAPGAFDASSLVFLSAEHQYQLDRALALDANGNPVDPGTAKYLLGLELTNAQRGEAIAAAGGNFAAASAIVQQEEGVKQQLASLSQPTTPTADQSAQLAQSQAQVLALTRGQGYQAALGSVLAGSGDLAQQSGFGAMVFLGDQASLRAGAQFFTKGVSGQSAISNNQYPVMI